MQTKCEQCHEPVVAVFTPADDRRYGQTEYTYQCACGRVGNFNMTPTPDPRLGQ